MNIVAVVLESIIIYGTGTAVFESEDPLPVMRALSPARGLTSPE